MPLLDVKNPTLLDVSRRLDPNGNIDTIVEILNQTNDILTDMVWKEGNLPTGHKTTIRTGLPSPTWRKLHGGVQPTKSTTAQVTDTCGMLEAYAEIDKALADLNGNTAAFRLSEDQAHIEGMSQTMATTLFYGNEGTQPEAFTGLAPRFNSLGAANGENIIDGGGTGSDNTSIWLCVWGDQTGHGIYPKGSKAGLDHRDLGEDTVQAEDGSGEMQILRTHFKWDCGLTVRDWRNAVRIANIKSLTKDAATGPDLIDLMTDAIERLPNLNNGGRTAFYMNRTARSFLRRQMRNAKNVNLTLETVAGKKVLYFDEVPVRRVDALGFIETAIA